jgi:hypothetical protein
MPLTTRISPIIKRSGVPEKIERLEAVSMLMIVTPWPGSCAGRPP